MNDILIALIIGIIAGTIDVIPMIIKKLDKLANLSAFSHWVILGLIIPFVDWNIEPWIKGLILGEISLIPILIIVYPKDKKALIPMIIFSAILGIGVAIAGSKFIGQYKELREYIMNINKQEILENIRITINSNTYRVITVDKIEKK